MPDLPHDLIPDELMFPGRRSGAATYCGNCYSILHTSNQCPYLEDE